MMPARLAFLAEARLDDARAPAADRRRVRQRQIMRVAARVAVHRHQAGHARAAVIFRAHGVAGAFRRDHRHVEIGARFDQVEMDVQPVREEQRRALAHVLPHVLVVDVSLQLVRREHHHHVSRPRSIGDAHNLQPLRLGLARGPRAFAQAHHDIRDAGIAQVQRMGMALAAEADDGDALVLDQVDVGITIVIDAHLSRSSIW